MLYSLTGVVITNVGRIRHNNEDNYYLFGEYKEDTTVNMCECELISNSENEVAAVFDGMGGGEAGEVASLLAASGIAALAESDFIEEQIARQIDRVNQRINKERIAKKISYMGTTMAAVYFDGMHAYVVNVGDSRVYLFRNNTLTLLSHDQTEGQRLVDAGKMKEEEAREYKNWHMLLQCLGMDANQYRLEPFFSEPVNLQGGDRFLICSDGLTDMVFDHQIEEILEIADNKNAAQKLVETALENGGRDNITVMIVDAV